MMNPLPFILLAISLPLLLGGCGKKVAVEPNLKYEIKDDAVTITDCDEGVSGALTIPATVEGNPVTSIGERAFYYCEGLTSLTIPEGVTSIGKGSFDGCTKLTNITIPDSVISIGKSAFSRCTSLTSITIPNGVTSIGRYAFNYCTSLTSITIPDGVTSIEMTAFYDCSNLIAIVVGEGNVNYTDVDGVLFNSEKTKLLNFPAGKKGTDYNIPNSVTSIGDDAFKTCTNITDLTIPDSVTTIGKDSFYGCTNLRSITIPNSVVSIGDYAFIYCTSLTSITIPAAVAVIRNGVFDSCENLTKLIFLGDAPEDKTGLINTFPTIYRKPEAKGWDDKWSNRPVELISEKP